MEPAGQHANAAIFAADGSARHRIVRAAIAAGVALLAAWVIALALGVLGGFGSLPGLPELNSRPSHPASAAAPHRRAEPRPVHGQAVAVKPASGPSSASGAGGGGTSAPRRNPTPARTTLAPSGSASPTSTSNGRHLGTTNTTGGKPLGSPGNGPGGSGAPGQLR